MSSIKRHTNTDLARDILTYIDIIPEKEFDSYVETLTQYFSPFGIDGTYSNSFTMQCVVTLLKPLRLLHEDDIREKVKQFFEEHNM